MKFTVKKQPDATVIELIGMIDEDCEISLDKLLSVDASTVSFDFKEIKTVNSCGLRAWINFLRVFQENKDLKFRHCTPDIVNQLNMIPSFQGSAKIESLYGEYFCENCKLEEVVLFSVGDNMPEDEDSIKPVHCKKCGAETEMMELAEEYFDCVISR